MHTVQGCSLQCMAAASLVAVKCATATVQFRPSQQQLTVGATRRQVKRRILQLTYVARDILEFREVIHENVIYVSQAYCRVPFAVANCCFTVVQRPEMDCSGIKLH